MGSYCMCHSDLVYILSKDFHENLEDMNREHGDQLPCIVHLPHMVFLGGKDFYTHCLHHMIFLLHSLHLCCMRKVYKI